MLERIQRELEELKLTVLAQGELIFKLQDEIDTIKLKKKIES